MSLNHSPKVATSNLSFYYDRSNTKKSWSGAPTTNLIVSTPLAFSTYAYASGPTTVTTQDENNIPITARRYTVTSAVNTARARITPSLTVGQTYTFSCKIRYNGTNTASPSFSVDASKGNPEGSNNTLSGVTGTTTVIGNKWYYLRYTFTLSASPTSAAILTYGVNTGADTTYLNNTFDVYEEQFEVGSNPTAYANGVRSSTQAIRDMISNTTLTVSGLTYDASNNFSFNGASRITGTLTGSASLTYYTRIVWCKLTTNNADMKSAMCNQIGNNSDMAVGIQNGYPSFHQYTKSNAGVDGDYTFSGSTLLTLNNVYMIAATVNRAVTTNNIKVYLNGVLDGTTSKDLTLAVSSSDNLIIGGPGTDSYSGARMWYGDIYAAMQYNRVLTELEIQQIFNSGRGRYGI